jgi:hypothetical protein
MVNETASSKRGVNPLCSLQSLGSKIRHCARQSVEKAFDGTPKLSQAVSQPTKKKKKVILLGRRDGYKLMQRGR